MKEQIVPLRLHQVRVLKALSELGNPASRATITEQAGLASAGTTACAILGMDDRAHGTYPGLVELGMIREEASKDGGRGVRYVITATGKQALEAWLNEKGALPKKRREARRSAKTLPPKHPHAQAETEQDHDDEGKGKELSETVPTGQFEAPDWQTRSPHAGPVGYPSSPVPAPTPPGGTPDDLPSVFGRYRILRKLGQGGMGAVYLAEDTQLARRVALKVPRFSAVDGPKVVERFKREARVAAAIEHVLLCRVYDVGEHDGRPYLTMEYVEGTPLAQLVDPDDPWEPRQAAELVHRIAVALDVLHRRGVMHRDLKPANIMLRPDGEPVLMDFGLARAFGDSDRLTSTGVMLGTPAHMSPEQILADPRNIGPATDQYSLGVILYQLLTGQVPFPGPSLGALCGQILHAPLQPASAVQPGVPPELDALCAKAMSKSAADRYSTTGEFAAALAVFLQSSRRDR